MLKYVVGTAFLRKRYQFASAKLHLIRIACVMHCNDRHLEPLPTTSTVH